jgi:hypothetical protein
MEIKKDCPSWTKNGLFSDIAHHSLYSNYADSSDSSGRKRDNSVSLVEHEKN